MNRHPPDSWWLEIFSGATAFVWALVSYFLDGDIGNEQAYRIAMRFFDNATWEQLAIFLAALQVIGCFGKSRDYRVIISGLTAVFWLFLGYTIHLAERNALGVIFYLIWGLANVVSMVLLARREAHE